MARSDTNLLAETVEKLAEEGKSPADVRFVLAPVRGNNVACGSWDDFARHADFSYDAGYGGAEVNMSLKIVGDDWWLERGEYDGSEWWEFKTLPRKPDKTEPLRNEDLKYRW